MIGSNEWIGIIIIILNGAPLILKKYDLIPLTAIISFLLMGLSLGGVI